MIVLKDVSFKRGTKQLLENANFSLFSKQKMGIVGNNGTGKTSLFHLVLGDFIPDEGDIQFPKDLTLSHLEQMLDARDQSALDYVLEGDPAYSKVVNELQKAEQTHDDDKVLACHQTLADMGGYQIPAKASQILAGLGFAPEEEQKPVCEFSGGWRMRLNLAKCLMSPADVFLLDEPTNHLDFEATVWLERWLKKLDAALLLISHDRAFLDGVVSHIVHIEDKKTHLYKGNYSQFETLRAEKLALQGKAYEKQQKKIAHLMSFVDRFRAKASKAPQAQSRLKAIAKMDRVAKANLDTPFMFEFLEPSSAARPLIRCEALTIGYDADTPIVEGINLSINPGDRFALLGPNGEGKSTFIKTLVGEIEPLSGKLLKTAKLNVGYYAQHHADQLDLSLTPIEVIQEIDKEKTEQSIRNFLGGFLFSNEMATSSIQRFSGGERARLALAKLVWLKPNLLLLDEPTNHLDIKMRSALEMALQSYQGALVIISHDRHLLSTTVDACLLVHQKKLNPFEGTLDDYSQQIKLSAKERNQAGLKPNESRHQDKKMLRNKIKQLERAIEQLQNQLREIEGVMAHPNFYDEHQIEAMYQTQEKYAMIRQKLNQAESEWLQVMAQLEAL